jgi:hypothetical protein
VPIVVNQYVYIKTTVPCCAYCGEQTILLILPAITNLPLRTMADVHNKKTRSFNMSQIKGKDTKPERIMLIKLVIAVK